MTDTLTKSQEEKEEREAKNEAYKKEFLARYNKQAKIQENVFLELKDVLAWIVKNKDSRNFIKNDGSFGKASQKEFDEKLNVIKEKHNFKDYVYYSTRPFLELKSSFSVKLESVSRFGDSSNWIRFENSIYFNHHANKIQEEICKQADLEELSKNHRRMREIDEETRKLGNEKNAIKAEHRTIYNLIF